MRLAVLLAALAAVAVAEEEDWNDAAITWLDNWTEAREKALKEGKPILALVHRPWCGACKALRPKFSASVDVASLSPQFVMARWNGDEGKDFDDLELFSPDGDYFPRILFFDSRARLMGDVVQRKDKYKYFHHDPSSIVKAMEEALKKNIAASAGAEEEAAREEL